MPWRTLVVGGVRSGKSRFAEELAAAGKPVTYLAAAGAGDAEMADRITRHRQRRQEYQPPWRTIEEPWELATVLRAQPAEGTLLVECLSMWLTNRLVGLPGHPAQDDETIRAETAALANAFRESAGRVIVVSNETGCGIMPVNALARRFGDLLGEANQCFAAAADEVYWCVAGIPVRIKKDKETRNQGDRETQGSG